MLFECVLVCLQVVLESFPVSSTGHLFLYQQLVYPGLSIQEGLIVSQEMIHFAHLPTFVIVLVWFRSYVSALLKRFAWRIDNPVVLLGFKIIGADLITVFFFFTKRFVPFSLPLWGGFLITALLLLSLRWVGAGNNTAHLSGTKVVILGIVQSVALIPGISRLAAVFVAARWMAFDNEIAFRLAWFLQLPLMAGAIARAILSANRHSVITSSFLKCSGWYYALALIGAVVSFWLMHKAVQKNKVWMFGIYVAIVAGIAWWIFFAGY